MHPDQFLGGETVATEVISFVVKAFCQEGDNIVTADKTFAVYEWGGAEFSGYEAKLIPLKDHGFDDEGPVGGGGRKRPRLSFCATPTTPPAPGGILRG